MCDNNYRSFGVWNVFIQRLTVVCMTEYWLQVLVLLSTINSVHISLLHRFMLPIRSHSQPLHCTTEKQWLLLSYKKILFCHLLVYCAFGFLLVFMTRSMHSNVLFTNSFFHRSPFFHWLFFFFIFLERNVENQRVWWKSKPHKFSTEMRKNKRENHK